MDELTVSQIEDKAVAEDRMAYLDSLPPAVRAVANGLPNLIILHHAWNAGCRTQEDAERWVRTVYVRDTAKWLAQRAPPNYRFT